MPAALGPIAPDDLPGAVVLRDGEAQAQQVAAGLEDSQDATHPVPLLLLTLAVLDVCRQLALQDAGRVVEAAFHHLEEVGAVLPARRRHAVPWPGSSGSGISSRRRPLLEALRRAAF